MASFLSRFITSKSETTPQEKARRLARSMTDSSDALDVLRASVAREATETMLRHKAQREEASGAAARLRLARPRTSERSGNGGGSAIERHEAVMRRGIERLSELTATYRISFAEAELNAIRTTVASTDKASSQNIDRKAASSASGAEVKENDAGAAIEVPFSVLRDALEVRFGNLDVASKPPELRMERRRKASQVQAPYNQREDIKKGREGSAAKAPTAQQSKPAVVKAAQARRSR